MSDHKGKPVVINTPVQKLYPLEVKVQTLKSSLVAHQNVNQSGVVNEGEAVKDAQGTPTESCSSAHMVEV